MIQQMGGKLAGRTAAFNETPADAVILTLVVELDDREAGLGVDGDVSEILAGTCHEEKFTCQVRYRAADRNPVLVIVQTGTNVLHFFGLQAVREVSAVSFMPALFIAVISHFDKSTHKFCIKNLHRISFLSEK